MPIKHIASKDIVILSYSAYSVFKQCPHRYYLEKIARVFTPEEDRSFTVPGLIAHKASEIYLKDGSEEEFKEESLDRAFEEYKQDPQVDLVKAYGSDEKARNFVGICADNLKRFLIARDIRSKRFLTEAWFGTWEDPLFLSQNLATQGAPDLIEINENNTAILYDYKATWSSKNLNKEQLILYSIAAELKFGVNITMCSFFLLPANKHVYFRFTQQDKERLLEDMQSSANRILTEGENLPCTPNEKCERCQFFSTCSSGKQYVPSTKINVPKVDFNGSSFGADL